jgi:hypothetical protein
MCIACAGFGSIATVARAVRALPLGSWYADRDRLTLARAVRSLPEVSGKWRHKSAPPIRHDRASLPNKRRRMADARQYLSQR